MTAIHHQIRHQADAPGGLAFFEWVNADPHRTGKIDRLYDYMDRAVMDGYWDEKDWDALRYTFICAGMSQRYHRLWDALREAVAEWLAYRAERGLTPDGFEVFA